MPFLIVAHVGHRTLGEVLLLFRRRPWLIRNRVAFDNALSGRTGAVSTHDFGMRSCFPLMVQEVPVGADQGVPDAVQVRMSIRRTRCPIRRKLSSWRRLAGSWHHGKRQHGSKSGQRERASKTVSHLTAP